MFGLLESRYGTDGHNPIVNVAIVSKRNTDHPKNPETEEESHPRSIWGVLGILESRYGHSSRSLSSKGEHSSEHSLDSPREFDRSGSSDEEALRFQLASDLASGRVDAGGRSSRKVIQEDMLNENKKDKHSTVRRRQGYILGAEHADHMVKTHKTERSIFKKSVQRPSSCHLNDAASLAHHKPSNSKEILSDKLANSEIFGPVCSHNPEMQQHAQSKGKASVERSFSDVRFNRGSRSNSRPVLSTNKELCSEFLPESNPLTPQRNVKDSGNVSCHCSSMQSCQKLDGRVTHSKHTSLSFKEMKRKLKHTFGGSKKESSKSSLRAGECTCGGAERKNSSSTFTNAVTKEKLSKKTSFKSVVEPDTTRMSATPHKNLDIPMVRLSRKQELDVICETKRYLSGNVTNDDISERTRSSLSQRTQSQIISSPDHDLWSISPRRESPFFYDNGLVRFCHGKDSLDIIESGLLTQKGKRICSSQLRPDEDYIFLDFKVNEETDEVSENEKKSPVARNAHDLAQCAVGSSTDYKNIDEEMNSIENGLRYSDKESEMIDSAQPTDNIESQKDDGVIHYVDSHSENDALSSTLDDILSTRSTSFRLDTADSSKYRQHRSPVSVLDPLFTDDTNNTPISKFQTAQRSLQPLRLNFEEHPFDSAPKSPQISANPCLTSQDHISLYVHSVLQAYCLNWLHLSEINPLPEEFLDTCLFNEVEFPRFSSHLNPQLLFDHMNEILLEIHRRHFSSSAWPTLRKPETMSVRLEEVVLEEIMRKADFYLLPKTEKTRLSGIVSKDAVCSGSWLDVRVDTDQIVAQVSDDVLEETIWEMLVEYRAGNARLLHPKLGFFI